MSRSHVLKASDAAASDVMLLGGGSADPTSSASTSTDPTTAPIVVESPSYSAAEVERLCGDARQAGAAEAAAVLEPALHRIADGLDELHGRGAEALAIALRADSERVATVALDIARWILGRELDDELEVLALATRALADSGAPHATRIRVNPDLADALHAVAPPDVAVIADSNLEPGEFTAETEGPDVSFRYTAALERARGVLTNEVGG